MDITKEVIMQDPYEFCEQHLENPVVETEADRLFVAACNRVVSFKVYGDRKPPNEAIIPDAWDYYTDQERQIMQEANHPFWQAIKDITG